MGKSNKNWIEGCLTVGSVKKEYRHLAFENHPDLGGDTATMQEINAAYLVVLAALDGQTSLGTDGKEHTYRYSEKVEQAVMDKISEVLKVAKPEWEVELIGTWLWVSGTAKADKDVLNKNGLGMKWHSKRERWYWHLPTYRRTYSRIGFNDLRAMYGSQVMEKEQQPQRAALVG